MRLARPRRESGEVITPENIIVPAAGDRPYVGVLSFGVHTHFEARGVELSLGADLNVTGPQTGLATLQSAIHDAIEVPGPSATTLSININRIYKIPQSCHSFESRNLRLPSTRRTLLAGCL